MDWKDFWEFVYIINYNEIIAIISLFRKSCQFLE